MWTKDWTRIEVNPQELIDACRGRRAQAWGYVVSHAMFLVRFHEVHQDYDVYIWCKGCEEVSFHSGWPDAELSLDIRRTGQDGEVEITDGDRLRILCGWAFWTKSAQSEGFLHLDDSMKISAD